MPLIRVFIHRHLSSLLIVWRGIYAFRIYLLGKIEQVHIAKAHKIIAQHVAKIRETNGKIRVGAYVYNGAVFQLECVFQRMLEDDAFDPCIVVSWCTKFESEQRRSSDWAMHLKTVHLLRERYGKDRVWDSFEGGVEHDYSDRFDLCMSMRPYDDGMLRSCQVSYLARKGLPVIYAHYGFEGGDVADKGVIGMASLGYMWRFYTGSKGMKELFEHLHPRSKCLGCAVLSGSPKIEPLAFQERRNRMRKRVIVAPHHTIDPEDPFYISNFVRFADFLISLPNRFPQIDWVFRPHPNLLPKMVSLGIWTSNQRDEYMERWNRFPNADVQMGGDYYDTFVNSDALIQDCSSFLAEYHATGHPQCYMLKSEEHAKTQYHGFGYELLNLTYKAFEEKDIVDFIEKVVVAGNDVMKKAREDALKDTLLLNYPKVSAIILADIKKALGRA